jgi:hypothetical protein
MIWLVSQKKDAKTCIRILIQLELYALKLGAIIMVNSKLVHANVNVSILNIQIILMITNVIFIIFYFKGFPGWRGESKLIRYQIIKTN